MAGTRSTIFQLVTWGLVRVSRYLGYKLSASVASMKAKSGIRHYLGCRLTTLGLVGGDNELGNYVLTIGLHNKQVCISPMDSRRSQPVTLHTPTAKVMGQN